MKKSLIEAQRRYYLREFDYISNKHKNNKYKHEMDVFCKRALRCPFSCWLYTMRYAYL
jgi:hypothetical protein